MSHDSEHPVGQAIKSICVIAQNELDGGEQWIVGQHSVTLIEACVKSGMHSHIPYVRVWAGDECLAEFCQHNIVGVYFDPRLRPVTDLDRAAWKAAGMSNIEDGVCTSCDHPELDCDCLPF